MRQARHNTGVRDKPVADTADFSKISEYWAHFSPPYQDTPFAKWDIVVTRDARLVLSHITHSDQRRGYVMPEDCRTFLHRLPTALRIAVGYVTGIWIVGLIALLVGAPRDIVLAAAVIGTAGGAAEWLAHRQL